MEKLRLKNNIPWYYRNRFSRGMLNYVKGVRKRHRLTYSQGYSLLSSYKYADAILYQIFEKIMTGMATTVWFDESKKVFNPTFKEFVNEYNQNYNIVFNLLNEFGFVVFRIRPEFELIMPGALDCCPYSNRIKYKNEGDYIVIEDNNFIVSGKTKNCIIKDVVESVDNVLNAMNTVVTKLGSTIFFSPPSESDIQVFSTEEERKEYEKKMESEYGMLDGQRSVCFFDSPLTAVNVTHNSAQLQLREKLYDFLAILCGDFGVPRELLPIYESKASLNDSDATKALQMLYQTVEKHVAIWYKIATEKLNLNVTYEIEGKPADGTLVFEQAKSDAADTVVKLVQAGILSIDEARTELSYLFDFKDNKNEQGIFNNKK